jgi:hypothetical protein
VNCTYPSSGWSGNVQVRLIEGGTAVRMRGVCTGPASDVASVCNVPTGFRGSGRDYFMPVCRASGGNSRAPMLWASFYFSSFTLGNVVCGKLYASDANFVGVSFDGVSYAM